MKFLLIWKLLSVAPWLNFNSDRVVDFDKAMQKLDRGNYSAVVWFKNSDTTGLEDFKTWLLARYNMKLIIVDVGKCEDEL